MGMAFPKATISLFAGSSRAKGLTNILSALT